MERRRDRCGTFKEAAAIAVSRFDAPVLYRRAIGLRELPTEDVKVKMLGSVDFVHLDFKVDSPVRYS